MHEDAELRLHTFDSLTAVTTQEDRPVKSAVNMSMSLLTTGSTMIIRHKHCQACNYPELS